MGKVESKQDLKLQKSIDCQIKSEIVCPICNKLLKGNMTFNQLNNHLKECDCHLRDSQNEIYDMKNMKNASDTNLKLRSMLDSNYLNNNIKTKSKRKSKIENTINSEPQRGTQIKNNMNSSEISNVNTVNDFQLVIDYNNTKNPDLYEEKLKNDAKKEKTIDKYSQLRRFLLNKKNLMNYDLKIECKNYKEIFLSLKNCNVYYNLKFILIKNKNPESSIPKKPKTLNLNTVLNKYFEIMIKNNNFSLINDTLFIPLDSKKVDYEMLGIIISILFIYPEIKLNYNLPLILCKIIVNQTLELNDLKYTNSDLYNNLYILNKDKNIEKKGLVYYYEGNELLIDGKNVKVNSSNVCDYIEKLINYQLKNYKNEINIIKNNLFQFIPKKYIFYFNGEDIYHIINRVL